MLRPAESGQTRSVLIADADAQRTAACLELMRPFSIRVRTAADRDEAIAVIERHGPPTLLLVDLSLPHLGGFAILDALNTAGPGGTAIIAWAAFGGLREFAANRLAGSKARILRSTAPLPVLAAAVERTLRREEVGDRLVDGSGDTGVERLHATMTELVGRARRLCGAAGVAVYLRDPGETQFRASVTWTSEAPIPDSPTWLPDVLSSVLETGRPFIWPDVTTGPPSNLGASVSKDGIRGLAAVPITADHQVVGMICVFDVESLTLDGTGITALAALGDSISPSATR